MCKMERNGTRSEIEQGRSETGRVYGVLGDAVPAVYASTVKKKWQADLSFMLNFSNMKLIDKK